MEVIEALEGGGYKDQEEDTEFKPTVRKKSDTPKDTTPRASTGGMAWWVEKTGVAEKFWDELGCEEYKDGIVFTFAGHQVVKLRRPPKEIIWTPKNADNPPLWPIPEGDLPEHVWITEGESDCGTACAAGHYAFTVTKGAKTELPSTWVEELSSRGVQQVTICGDTDGPGQDFRKYLEKAIIDAGLVCSVVHLELVLDPFSGANDLNSLWHHCDYNIEKFNEILSRATHKVDSRFPILTFSQIKEIAATNTPWVVRDLLAPGDKALITGPQKSYKTWIALDLARSLVTGRNFLERPEWEVMEPSKVLFVQEEGSQSAWAKRLCKLNMPPEAEENFISMHRRGIRFTDSSTVDTIIAICRQEEISVVFFDPLQRMMPGIDENDSAATGVVWDEIFRLQFALPHLIAIVLHHSNKSERLTWESVRGSSRHAGEVDLGIFCQKHPLEDHTVRIAYDGRDIPSYLGTGESFEAKVEISQEEEPPHFKIDAREVVPVIANVTHLQGKRNKDSILDAISNGSRTRKEIMEVTGCSDSTTRTHIDNLVVEGKIEEVPGHKEKHYREKVSA